MAVVRKTLEQVRSSRPRVNRSRIAATTERDIRRHAMEDGQNPDGDLTVFEPAALPQEIRKRLGMTQEAFAAALHIPVSTLRNWEQGRVTPDPAARALLTIVARKPKAAFEA